jgi:ABC-2 type transport system ATP-binding protein
VIARSTDKSVRVRTPDAERLAGLITAAGGKATPGAANHGESATGNGAPLLTVTGLEAAKVGEIAASASIVLHELTPMASLEDAYMELTSGSLEFGEHVPAPAEATQGSAR